jgi:hypothetical protein
MERGLECERSMQANERVMLDIGRFTLPNDGKGTGLGFRSVQVGACVSACTMRVSERVMLGSKSALHTQQRCAKCVSAQRVKEVCDMRALAM